MVSYDSDAELFEVIRRHLYTPVLGDSLDALGRLHQFLPPELKSIGPDMTLVGRCMPVLVADVFGPQLRPFGRLTEALDQLQPGDIYLARTSQTPCAAWGELLTATAIARGAAGAVIDGYHRDTPQILAQGFPVFSRGGYAQDGAVRAAVIDYRIAIDVGRVHVSPGDLIVGDRDGLVVVPQDVEQEVIEMALVKAAAENVVKQAIEGGMSSTMAFETYGVL